MKSTTAPTHCPMTAYRVTVSDILEWARNGYRLLSYFQALTLKALFTFTFLCTFHFGTEAAKNGTQVLYLAKRVGLVHSNYHRNRETKDITARWENMGLV